MGYTKEGSIDNFWPDDTETTMYLAYETNLAEIFEIAKRKWPEATLESLEISAEKIHTSCIYYDLYDGGDWTNFLVITYNKP